MRDRSLLPLCLLALAWLQEGLDQLLFAGGWNLPMGPGLPIWRVLTAPFSHAGWSHLVSNSLAFLPLSWLVLSRGVRSYLNVWMGVLVMTIPVALLWPRASHGLSGVVYGLLGYLIVIGWVERRPWPILLSAVALWFYGPTLVTLIPGVSPAGVSWVGHLSGFCGGIAAALTTRQHSGDGPQAP